MKLEKWIKKNKLIKPKVAEMIGVNRVTLHAWLTGKNTPLKIYQEKIEQVTNGEVPKEEWKIK